MVGQKHYFWQSIGEGNLERKQRAKMPDWLKEVRRSERRMLGNPTGWGGYRIGAGRPPKKKPTQGLLVSISINRIQELNLLEMGEGDINKGVQVLIDKHL